MGPTTWRELERSIHDAQEEKQSNAVISLTCLKNLWRELRSYHRQDGMLGYGTDNTIRITPGRASELAMDIYREEHNASSDTELHAQYMIGTDIITVTATRKNCTFVEKYKFSKIESKFKVQIIC